MCKWKSSGKKIFILGAGFSKPAGLPLGSELLNELQFYLKYSLTGFHSNEIFEEIQTKIDEFKCYSSHLNQKSNDVDIEKFLEYIDTEHFLNLLGFNSRETMDEKMDDVHLIFRNAIAGLLRKKQKEMKNIDLYDKFSASINPGDLIISLNYDTILEDICQKNGIEFNMFPPYLFTKKQGYKKDDCATILKLHGSINWFSIDEYMTLVSQHRKENVLFRFPKSIIFNDPEYFAYPLAPPQYTPTKNIKLDDIYWVKNEHLDKYIDSFNKTEINNCAPLIANPSFTKLLYIEPIKDLFHSLGAQGGEYKKIYIIGCSLPNYDSYIKQLIYYIIRQYLDIPDNRSNKVVVINKASDKEELNELHQTYSFINKFTNKQNLHLVTDGLTIDVVNSVLT